MLCNRIKQFRTYNNIETESLAKILKVEHSEYLKYESGEVVPDIDIIASLSKIYKVTINEFYGHEKRLAALQNEDSPYKTPEEYEALKFAELSIDEKEIILAYRASTKNKERFLKLIEDEEN